MDGRTFIVEVIKGAAWPLVVIGCVVGFRTELRVMLFEASQFLRQARSFKAFGVEGIRLETAAAEVKLEAQEIKAQLSAPELLPDERALLRERLAASEAEAATLKAVAATLKSQSQFVRIKRKDVVDAVTKSENVEVLKHLATGFEKNSLRQRRAELMGVAAAINDSFGKRTDDGLAEQLEKNAFTQELRLAGILDDEDKFTPLGSAVLMDFARLKFESQKNIRE